MFAKIWNKEIFENILLVKWKIALGKIRRKYLKTINWEKSNYN